jgi:hypothetical protein
VLTSSSTSVITAPPSSPLRNWPQIVAMRSSICQQQVGDEWAGRWGECECECDSVAVRVSGCGIQWFGSVGAVSSAATLSSVCVCVCVCAYRRSKPRNKPRFEQWLKQTACPRLMSEDPPSSPHHRCLDPPSKSKRQTKKRQGELGSDSFSITTQHSLSLVSSSALQYSTLLTVPDSRQTWA